MQCGFLRIYVSTLYSVAFLLYAHAPAPIKIDYDAVWCSFCDFLDCIDEAYTLDRRKSSQGWKYISRLNLWGSKGPSSWEHTKLGRGSIPDSPTRTFEKK